MRYFFFLFLKMTRIDYIDFIRGIAIIFMIIAHSIPFDKELITNSPFIIRTTCSFAAPIFLFLLGINFNKNVKFANLSIRILVILFLGILLDLFLWKIIPFYSFDILYAISISLTILFLVKRFSQLKLLILIVFIIIISFLYQSLGYYPDQVPEPDLYNLKEIQFFEMVFNLFFDGWFPIFPWIIFPLLGYLYKNHNYLLISIKNLVFVAPVFVNFVMLLSMELHNYRSYSIELFYPASTFFIFASVSLLHILFILLPKVNFQSFKPILYMGRISLFIYFFHLIILHLTFEFTLSHVDNYLWVAILIYISFFIFVSYLLNQFKLKEYYPKKSKILNTLFGH